MVIGNSQEKWEKNADKFTWKHCNISRLAIFQNALESVNWEMCNQSKKGLLYNKWFRFHLECIFNLEHCTIEGVNWEMERAVQGRTFNFFDDSLSSRQDASNILLDERICCAKFEIRGNSSFSWKMSNILLHEWTCSAKFEIRSQQPTDVYSNWLVCFVKT